MFQTKHELTEGEKKCLEEYERNKSPRPRKNLIRLVRHINMLNPLPDEHSWEYIFFDRQLDVPDSAAGRIRRGRSALPGMRRHV